MISRFKKRSKPVTALIIFLFLIQISGFEEVLACCPSHSGQNIGGGIASQGPGKKDTGNAGKHEDEMSKHDPVYECRGEYYYRHQDLFIPSRAMAVDITRNYLSQKTYNGRFGYGWFLSVNIQLKVLHNNNGRKQGTELV